MFPQLGRIGVCLVGSDIPLGVVASKNVSGTFGLWSEAYFCSDKAA